MGDFRTDTRTLRRVSLAAATTALFAAAVVVTTVPPGSDAAGVPIVAFSAPAPAPTLGQPWRYAPAWQQFVPHVSFPDAGELRDFFNAIEFDLAGVRAGTRMVPRVFLASLPEDYHRIEAVTARKRTFLRVVLPLVLRVNEELRADRARLATIVARAHAGTPPPPEEAAWALTLSARYGVEPGDWAELMRRVDTVSPALALAQAAEESGWATSRFAREGNAVFGQWSWRAGSGLVPVRRSDGASHEVRSFETLLDSVRAYATNLNTHPSYERFRAARAALRAEGRPLDATALAATLDAYSERGDEYIETLHAILRANRLQQFEDAQLAPPEPATAASHHLMARNDG
ncbi:MAG: glucosaminidase domain-containing protein [Alphaproteobacteria bacterium]